MGFRESQAQIVVLTKSSEIPDGVYAVGVFRFPQKNSLG